MESNKITGANAGGRRQLPMGARWAARVAQFGRSVTKRRKVMFGFGRKDDAEKRAKQILKEIEKRNTAVSALVWKVSKAECDAAILQLEIADAAAYEQLARIEKNPGVAEHYRELAQKYRQAVQEDREKLTKLPRSQIPTQRCAICGKPTGGTTYCSVHTTMMYGLGKHHGH